MSAPPAARIHRAALVRVLALALSVAALVSCVTGRIERSEVAFRGGAATASNEWRYAVVIDAGSSGSRALVYQWRPVDGQQLPQIEVAPFPRPAGDEPWEERVNVGLSSFAERPADAPSSLAPLVDFALARIGPDPRALARTTVILRATAGLRLLTSEQQAELMSSVERYFDGLPFGSTSARVVSGTEEGVYGWITANYLLGHLRHGGAFPTVGALDLGGASTQITFVPLDHPAEHGQILELGGRRYHLYTHSYLGLGQDEARAAVAAPACFLNGYPLPDAGVGTGDFAACREAIRAELARPCAGGERGCTLFGAYQPPPYGEFLAFSVFAYTADFLGLDERLAASLLESEGSRFCAESWPELVAQDPELENDSHVPNYCFSAAYVATLLSDVFGFPEVTDRIRAPRRVQGAEIGWTLGALLYELAGRAD